MTGKKAFDEQQVLRAALNVFRLKGYAGAGLSELEAATGLNRSSLYNAYGNKQGLFLRTLILFREAITEMALKELERPNFRDALAAFCEASGAFSRPGFPGGCPHTLGSLEMGREGGKISDELARGIDAMIGRVVDGLGNAIDGMGEISTSDTRRVEIDHQ